MRVTTGRHITWERVAIVLVLLLGRRSGTEAAYVIVTAALLYAHLYGVFTLLAQHLAYGVDWWSRRRPARDETKSTPPPDGDVGEIAAPPLPARRWVLLNGAV